jgi:hypothetical protein
MGSDVSRIKKRQPNFQKTCLVRLGFLIIRAPNITRSKYIKKEIRVPEGDLSPFSNVVQLRKTALSYNFSATGKRKGGKNLPSGIGHLEHGFS